MNFGFKRCPVCRSIMDEIDYGKCKGNISGNRMCGVWYHCRNRECGIMIPKEIRN